MNGACLDSSTIIDDDTLRNSIACFKGQENNTILLFPHPLILPKYVRALKLFQDNIKY